METVARDVGYPSEPNAADPPPVLLRRYDNDRLVFRLAAVDAFFVSTNIGLIHLHTALEAISAGPDHRTAQLMEPTPSRLVAAQAEQLLKTQRTSLQIFGW